MDHSGTRHCQKEQHSHQFINYLCLEEQCKGNRLLCHLCLRDCQHTKHSRTNFDPLMEPFSRLSMNYQHPSSTICIDSFSSTITSVLTNWDQIAESLEDHFTRLKTNLIHPLQTISQTFSQNLISEVGDKLTQGKATEQEIEEYAKMINFLGRKDFNDPEKLMQVVSLIQKNIGQAVLDLKKKIEMVCSEFQNKVNKYNLSTNSLDSIIQMSKNKSKDPLGFSKTHNSESKSKVKASSIKEQQKQQAHQQPTPPPSQQQQQQPFPFQSVNKDPYSEDLPKIEEDTLETIREFKIGWENQGVIPLKGELKARVKRLVVDYCMNPEKEFQKILSYQNVEELQINWYPFAKKQCILRIMNNMPNLKVWVMNCANEFDEECSRMVPKKLPKLRRLEYGWDFLNALRDYDQNIYFRLSPFTNRGSPLKTSVTREMVVSLKKLQNVWLGDFMYFRPSNNEIPFKNIKQFILGQTTGKYFRIPDKLCTQLKDMKQLLSLSILHVRIDEKKLIPILLNNSSIKTFIVEGCDDISDESLKVLAKHGSLIHLSVRDSKMIEGSPVWDMHSLSSLVMVECERVKVDEVIAGLPKMTYLTYLNLYGNTWVIDDVVKQIPNSESFQGLNLGRTSITDQALPAIARMKRLKSLSLDCTRVSGGGLAELSASLSGLNKLSLWGFNGEGGCGSIGDSDLQRMTKELVSLHQLYLRYCKKVNGELFLKFASLRFLEVDSEYLSAEVKEELVLKGVKLIYELSNEVEEV